MINLYINKKVNNIENIDEEVNINDINASKKVLFSLFTRYGDTIIDLCVIKEFIETYPNKKYTILCPNQMIPYVNKILPNINAIGLNKRNIFSFLKMMYYLKKENYDIGFNPWSNGNDSCYWISFCKKFICYKSFKRPTLINHYEVVRSYLKLTNTSWKTLDFDIKDKYRKIIICPESTDSQRSISYKETKDLVFNLQKKYMNIEIIICALDPKYFLDDCSHFKFNKSKKSSSEFINILEEDSLCICVDSGPLHIITALKLDTIGIFNITTADVVVNIDSKIKIINKGGIYDI